VTSKTRSAELDTRPSQTYLTAECWDLALSPAFVVDIWNQPVKLHFDLALWSRLQNLRMAMLDGLLLAQNW